MGASIGRTVVVVGTVVDTAGAPVAGAKVVIGYGAMFEGGEHFAGGRSTMTSQDGSFAVADVPLRALGPLPLGAAADHPHHGRSMPVEIVDGDSPPLALVLRPTGSIAGRILRGGRPLEDVIVGIGWPELCAPTIQSGTFFASEVPAGEVEIFVHPMDGRWQSQSTTVNVVAGTTTNVEIDVPVGKLALVVDLKPRAGARVAGARVHLFSGIVSIVQQRQVAAKVFLRSRGIERWRAAIGSPPRFRDLVPGEHTLCVLPLDHDPTDGRFIRELRERGGDLRVYCTPIRLAPEPAEQTVTIDLPAAEPLPAS